MRNRLAWWDADRSRSRADASDMLLRYGERALDVACRLAKSERRGSLPGIGIRGAHWDRVRRIIKRQLKRESPDA